MTIREIKSPDDSCLGPLLDLYHREFPPETREPDDRLIKELQGNYRIRYRYLVADEVGRFAGFVRWAYLPDTEAMFVIHIAVDEPFRCRGLGSQLVQLVRNEHPQEVPTLMEVEEHVWPWWERQGARIVTRSYTQPSLGPGLSDVPLWLAAIDPQHCVDRKTVGCFYREVWGLNEDDTLVRRAILGVVGIR